MALLSNTILTALLFLFADLNSFFFLLQIQHVFSDLERLVSPELKIEILIHSLNLLEMARYILFFFVSGVVDFSFQMMYMR